MAIEEVPTEQTEHEVVSVKLPTDWREWLAADPADLAEGLIRCLLDELGCGCSGWWLNDGVYTLEFWTGKGYAIVHVEEHDVGGNRVLTSAVSLPPNGGKPTALPEPAAEP